MKKHIGFLDYRNQAVGVDGCIIKGSLRSLASIQGAAAYVVGTPVYTSEGFVGANGAGTSTGIAMPVAAGDLAEIARGGTMGFKCSTAAFDKRFTPTVAQNFIIITGNSTHIWNREVLANSGYIKLFNGGTVMNGSFYRTVDAWASGNGVGRGPMSDVLMTWNAGGVKIWVDEHLFLDAIYDSMATRCTFVNFILNSSSTSNGGTYTYADFFVTTKQMVIPRTTKGMRVVHGYGDSYMQQRSTYTDVTATGQQQAFGNVGIGTGNPTADGKTGTGYNGSVQGINDAGIFPTLRRKLAKQGIFVGNISPWGQGGAGFLVAGVDTVNKVQDRITTALRLERPDVCFLINGYNDATTNGGAGPSDLPAYQALVLASVDEIIAKNADVDIIITTLPFKNGDGFTASITAVTNINAQYVAVAALRPNNVTVDDKFTQWGGAVGTPSYFQAADPHPTDTGTQDYGRTLTDIIIKKVLA